MKKINIAIIGTGNIGCDLLIKVQRSKILKCNMFIGQNKDSTGLKLAQLLGVDTSFDSINEVIKNPHCYHIVFDATSAEAHKIHAPILKSLNKFTIDMTPSKIEKMCVPSINLEECLKEQSVNLITCGGQATIPIISAIMKIHPETKYVEIISSISSKSAGIATRNNIDEYAQTTSEAINTLGGAPKSKAIIILNPSEPPILMHNTIFAEINNPNIRKLVKEIGSVIKEIQKYVPGYKLTLEPVFENNRLTIMTEVIGRGDFLPIYAGNLDIINCAAINVAEAYAKKYFNN